MKLGDVGRSIGNAVLENVGRAASRVQESRPLPTDVLESDDAYLVVFDAPGAGQSDLQVRYVDGSIEVRIDRFREFYEDFEMRAPGRGMSLDGRADLPDDAVVDAAASSATLRANGTLEVRVPKAEPSDDEVDASAGTVEIAAPEDDDTAITDVDAVVADDGVDDAPDVVGDDAPDAQVDDEE